MPTKPGRTASRTLFDVDFRSHEGAFRVLPYCMALHSASEHPRDARFDEVEAAIFSHVVEHEIALYEPRGMIVGPLVWKVASSRAVDLGRARSAVKIPTFVESDALHFLDCSAAGILLVDRAPLFMKLAKSKAFAQLKMLLVTGEGIPRFAVRRFLHRLSGEFKLPVYQLTDNDTWGYFTFSVLKRGLLGPQSELKPLQVADLRFLGLTTGDVTSVESCAVRPWKPIWDLRMKCLERYRCFRSAAWQSEFAAFTRQRFAVDADTWFSAIGGAKAACRRLAAKMHSGNWLK